MRIESVVYEGGVLKIQTDSSDAKKLAYKFKPGEYELKKVNRKRSNDANSYCWLLCTEIGKVLGEPPTEIYRQHILELSVYKDIILSPDESKTLRTAWERLGIGWQTERVDFSEGQELIRFYYGSSVYSVKQMSTLLDALIQDAQAIGIETLDEQRINSLLEEWDDKKNKGVKHSENR